MCVARGHDGGENGGHGVGLGTAPTTRHSTPYNSLTELPKANKVFNGITTKGEKK